MKLFSVALKLNSLFAGKIACQSSLIASDQVQSGFDSSTIGLDFLGLLVTKLGTLIINFLYVVCRFLLNFIELMQFGISRILGIESDIKDYVVIDKTNPLVKMLTDETVLTVFKTVCGVAIVLIIIFTIISIIKSEYAFAVEKAETNGKGRILGRSLRSLFTLTIFPLVLIFGVVLTNAILAGFNDILRNNGSMNIASQIFLTSAYNANNFRNYAEDDQRIPVVVNFEDPANNGQINGYDETELVKIYDYFQDTGRYLYDAVADRSFGSFSETVVYKNNRIYNKSSYSGFEKFAVTREQYYVMADFIDYAVKNNISYYVKNIKDVDIDWKYVDETIFDKNTYSLTIRYKDASSLSGSESYEVIYTPTSESITTPISDALKTISALLAFDDYADNTFNILSRDENSTNYVEWETDKVLIRFSDAFVEKLNKTGVTGRELLSVATKNDLLILYEQSRFKKNNTIDATIEEIAQNGYELPVKKVTKRTYQSITHDYIETGILYVVTINGTNYEVELNEELKDTSGAFIRDNYNDPYYTLVETDFGLETVSGSSGNYKANGKSVDDEKVLEIKVNEKSLGKFTLGDDSFKDIKVSILTGTKEIRDEVSGLVSYVSYDDQIETIIKQNAFPNKLINDLQVIYSGININDLIAKGTWLEQLSEYVSGGISTETSNIQTGLIHPLGLILSEMFLGNVSASEKILSMGDLEYSSKFDSDTIKALILSTLGENRYFQTDKQLEYFVEIFNAYMAPVLDEIAYYQNFELLSGNSQSVQLYTYKAYLASVLLTADSAEWFYNTAISYLGAVKLKEDIISSAGTVSSFSSLTPFYQTYIRNLYESADQKLRDQFVTENDKSYPEYMKALKAYINGNSDDYFDGRLDLILQSVLSDEKKGELVDNAKSEIKTNYENLVSVKQQVFNYINGLEMSSEEKSSYCGMFETNFNSFFSNPYSSFSYKANNYTGDDRSKDDFDILDNVYSLSNFQEDVSIFASDENVNGSFLNYIENLTFGNNTLSGDLKSNLKGCAENYYSSVNNYINRKIEFYDTDNSSSNVGKHDEIQREIDKAFSFAKVFYALLSSDDKNIIKTTCGDNAEIIMDDISGLTSEKSKQSHFVGENWNKLKTNYEKLNQYYIQHKDEEGFEANHTILISYINQLGTYVKSQESLDKLNRYEILFALDDEIQSNATQSLDIVVDSIHYQVGQNFTKAKFIEYVLGYETCKKYGYSPVFVDEGYEGLVSFKAMTDDEIKNWCQDNIKNVSSTEATEDQKNNYYHDTAGKYGPKNQYYEYDPESYLKLHFSYTQDESTNVYTFYKITNGFSDVYDFAVQIGEISAHLYQMSNLANLSSASFDEIVIEKENDADTDLTHLILQFILQGEDEYLPEDLVKAFFGVEDSNGSVSTVSTSESVYEKATQKIATCSAEVRNEILNTVMSYLLVTETDKDKKDFVDYTKLTLKDIRIKCLEALIDFEQQSGETVEQNQKRYLTLLAIGCSDWNMYDVVAKKYGGAFNCNWSKENRQYISSLKTNNQSQAVILRLAGLENRPYEELVDAEYSIDFNLLGEDERNGDVFIICLFDNETKKYFPFMMSNNSDPEFEAFVADEEGKTFIEYFDLEIPYTSYYYSSDDNDEDILYPVIARGIVDSEGMPTAIRKVDGNIEYYRDEVVIRDASDIGLEAYYLSVDQITVKQTGLSAITNGISKLFTGKTIVEHLAASIPRFAAHTDYNFCFGVDTTVVTRSNGELISMSYNFGKGNNLEMKYFYDINKVDILLLLIGTFSLVTALMKALFACIGRLFDITIDFVIAPVAISTIALKADVKGEKGEQETQTTYDTWKTQISNHILSVLSFAIGFNIFFILAPIIAKLNLFDDVTIKVFENLPLIRLITPGMVNEIVRLMLLVGLGGMTARAPKIFAGIISIQDAFTEGKNVKDSVKAMKNTAMQTWTGEAMMNDLKATTDNLKNMIPGSQIAKEAETMIKKATGASAGKAVEIYARAKGVPKEAAKVLGDCVKTAMTKDPKQEEIAKYRQQKAQRKQLEKNRNNAKNVVKDEKNGENLDKKPDKKENKNQNKKDDKKKSGNKQNSKNADKKPQSNNDLGGSGKQPKPKVPDIPDKK